MKTLSLILLSFSLGVLPNPVIAAPLPTRIGQCSNTTIKWVGNRLEDGITHESLPGSGSAVSFTNGGYQVSYESVSAIEASRAGDPVKLCLESIPHPCPPGDNRGRFYKTLNYRTGRSWTLPDSQHLCGGA